MRPNEYPEAPTHLGSHQLPLPPEWLPGDDDLEPATRAARATELPRVVTERSVNRYQAEVTPRGHGHARPRGEQRSSVAAPALGPPPTAPRRESRESSSGQARGSRR